MKRSRNWCFTINNYTEDELAYLTDELTNYTYLVCGKEIAKTGTPHLQGYICFSTLKSFAQLKKLLPRAHLSSAKGNSLQNYEYCTKDGDFFELGERPMTQSEKGKCEQERWDQALTSAKEGRQDDIPSDIRIRYYNTLKNIERDHQPRPPTLTAEKTGVWIWGPSGVGKSSYARANYPDYYTKNLNKWFCGYQKEPFIILDDISPRQHYLQDLMKTWLDRYPFQAETKGSSTFIRPELFILTSQYTPEECFEDPNTVEAIRRRCTVIHMDKPFSKPTK